MERGSARNRVDTVNATKEEMESLGSQSSIEELTPAEVCAVEDKKKWCYKITVEPMLFLHMLAYMSSLVVVQNFYIDVICQNEFGEDPDVNCSNLMNYTSAETIVQQIATRYSTYRSLIDSGLPVLFSLFIGPWSDKHGSKPMMLLPLIGYICSAILFYIFSRINNPVPDILLFASLPIALTGGIISFVLSAFRHVTAISSTENRSLQMAIAQGAWFLGSPIGLLGSSALLRIGGYQLVFLICIIVYSASFLYSLLFIKSDKPICDVDTHIIKDMFNLAAVKETFQTAFKPRTGSKRLWLWLLLGVIYLKTFTIYGTSTIAYLYTQHKFEWHVEEYSTYSTFDGLISITGTTAVAIIGMKFCRIQDTTIGLLSAMGYLSGAVIWFVSSFTTSSWLMYLGSSVQMFSGLVTTVARSMLSKLFALDEIGKVYSFLASGEAAMPLLTAPLYNFIYEQTVEYFPGAVYIVNCSLDFVLVILFVYLCMSSWNATINNTADQINASTEPED